MATVTPNYNWPVPTSTDFVKDGASSIEALGDAIDATVFALPKIETVLSSGTFTAVSAVNMSSVLSNTYSFYTLKFYGTTSTSDALFSLRFRENTTDVTTSYTVSGGSLNSSGAFGNFNSGSDTQINNLGTATSTDPTFGTLEIMRPSATQGIVTTFDGNVRNARLTFGSAYRQSMTNFNGLSLLVSTGTMTGFYILTGRKP